MLKEKLIHDKTEYLRSGNRTAVTLLGTVLGELDRLKTKNINDSHVLSVIKGIIESNQISKNPNSELEKTILEKYLPVMLDEFQLACHITEIVENNNYTIKDMGKIMKELKDTIPGQYDGKLASETIKKLLD